MISFQAIKQAMMEGVKCMQKDCNVHDFLPFNCPRCNFSYCLDHRSRFVHDCVAEDTKQPAKQLKLNLPSVRSMFDAVTNRFSHQTSADAPDHHRIKSSTSDATLADGLASERLKNSMDRLNRLEHATLDEKVRRRADQTRKMILKNHAQGNREIGEGDRIYMTINILSIDEFLNNSEDIRPSPDDLCVFFSRNAILGDVLQRLKVELFDSHIRQHLGQALSHTNADGISLAISTEDSPDWRCWDRSVPLSELLASFDEVKLIPISIDEALAYQQVIESSAAAVASHPVPESYLKGSLAWYHRSKQRLHNLEEAVQQSVSAILVKIIGVHHDDFPNIYYTIQVAQPLQLVGGVDAESLVFHSEKQTDGTHLFPGSTELAAPVVSTGKECDAYVQLLAEYCGKGDIVSFTTTYAGREVADVRISLRCQVHELKRLLAVLYGISANSIKLIIKGTILKQDTQVLRDTKLRNGVKLMVVGL